MGRIFLDHRLQHLAGIFHSTQLEQKSPVCDSARDMARMESKCLFEDCHPLLQPTVPTVLLGQLQGQLRRGFLFPPLEHLFDRFVHCTHPLSPKLDLTGSRLASARALEGPILAGTGKLYPRNPDRILTAEGCNRRRERADGHHVPTELLSPAGRRRRFPPRWSLST